MPRRANEAGELGNQNMVNPKRISSHVEEKELWNLKRCLVGEMASVYSTQSILLRLQNWGIGEINVLRMGSKTFLLSFEDDELYMMLEDLNWSYLREIFVEDSESTTESSSVPEKKVPSEGDRSYSRVEEEALNVMCADKSFNNCQAQGSKRTSCQLGEFEQIGGGFKEYPEVISDNQEKQPGVMENVRGNECNQSFGTKCKRA
ncbi:hypothetical protein V6N13_104610 [Hibiscus sabdariffa]